MSKLLHHGRALKTTSAAVAARRARDTRVRVFKPDLAGVTRCISCGAPFGEPHRDDCAPDEPSAA